MSERPTFREAIRAALRDEMLANQDMVMLGEVLAYQGGSTYVAEGLADELGRKRILETPVSENAIVGSAFGAALAGMTVMAEIFSSDFLFAVGQEVWNDMAKWRYQHRYRDPLRLVVRGPMGSAHVGQGPEHTQCPEAYLAHGPGLTVVAPSTAREAGELMRQALGLGDPVIFLEHRRLYDLTDDPSLVPDAPIQLGTAARYAVGSDVTVVAWAWMFQEALQAVARLEQQGVGVDLFSLHTPGPLNFEPIGASVARTGRLVVVEEAPQTLGFGAELVARAHEASAGRPIATRRVAMPDVVSPFSPALETPLVPDAERIFRVVWELVAGAKLAV